MAINIDKALGIYPQTLELRSKRAEILANNIANQDTPGFKAKDLDFKTMLMQSSAGSSLPGAQLATVKPMTTQSGHQNSFISGSNMDSLKYRLPTQPSIDGNTVDGEVEKAEYAKNSMRFQASFMFLNGSIKNIIRAIKGTD